MQGNIVTAAKWLGASLVLASVVLAGMGTVALIRRRPQRAARVA